MITAMEIRNQQFSKAVRGYKEDEVKNFLYQLAQDYEALYSENVKLREEMQRVEYEIEKYRKIEETMNNSLVLAQQTAEEVKNNAQKEADLILENSKRKIAETLMIYQEIIKRLNLFNAELKSQVNGQLELLEKNEKKVEELSNFFYAKDIKDVLEKLEKATLVEN
ncbi:Cell division initiation protein DivIVA [Candidatus Syntrophocurvum alkaliphilum]|uniref:Cell division initiation protein DivIVA n=1 Tax=Candidatus Syntrophocurvum alkaliphilum TaxID=2293317 RepID=A0A6I6DBM4_9FIRM|nr:DivIVA domain-containing protein [Candidatus Syntrophocurvum alkaliphilum]QGT99689.1 Cell division initiation protein DivIVA [Candidatus Syntrophocurvum alkaliphilum]